MKADINKFIDLWFIYTPSFSPVGTRCHLYHFFHHFILTAVSVLRLCVCEWPKGTLKGSLAKWGFEPGSPRSQFDILAITSYWHSIGSSQIYLELNSEVHQEPCTPVTQAILLILTPQCRFSCMKKILPWTWK